MGLGLSPELSKALLSYRDQRVARLGYFAKLILKHLLAILPLGAFLGDPFELPLQLVNARGKLRHFMLALTGQPGLRLLSIDELL
jgi:hypothetical protein